MKGSKRTSSKLKSLESSKKETRERNPLHLATQILWDVLREVRRAAGSEPTGVGAGLGTVLKCHCGGAGSAVEAAS